MRFLHSWAVMSQRTLGKHMFSNDNIFEMTAHWDHKTKKSREQIELQAKILDYFLWSNKRNINLFGLWWLCWLLAAQERKKQTKSCVFIYICSGNQKVCFYTLCDAHYYPLDTAIHLQHTVILCNTLSEDCFYYYLERNNVAVLFGTLKVQSFILTEVSDCGVLIVVTSSTFLKRKDMLNKKKAISPRSHPASKHIYTHVYFVHIYEYMYTKI